MTLGHEQDVDVSLRREGPMFGIFLLFLIIQKVML